MSPLPSNRSPRLTKFADIFTRPIIVRHALTSVMSTKDTPNTEQTEDNVSDVEDDEVSVNPEAQSIDNGPQSLESIKLEDGPELEVEDEKPIDENVEDEAEEEQCGDTDGKENAGRI